MDPDFIEAKCTLGNYIHKIEYCLIKLGYNKINKFQRIFESYPWKEV